MANFKARARAVDMLGRQQIAGIPTAINELFKNAHDAYADTVVADYFRDDRLLVVRDDGVGMSRQEFIDKWLVVGTESKVGGGLTPPPGKPRRPVLGEKGIGRLAVAAVGPQVLVTTRSVHDAANITLALVNWTLFTAPRIDLADVNVPVISLPAGRLPTKADISRLVDALLDNIEQLRGEIPSEIAEIAAKDCRALARLDPERVNRRLRGPSLQDASGTHFWIVPTDEMLTRDISGNPNDELQAPPLLKMLIGFSDTMVPGHSRPPMVAQFVDHRTNEVAIDLIGEAEFFTQDEFRTADHQISGRFDEYGQFVGTVTVYGGEPKKHVVSWPASRGHKTLCGPFELNLAYVQGTKSASRLSPEDFNRTLRKLSRVGGLYVYRDRVRVLPYGNHDFDWLEIERERSKSASDYFWSYRRLFGAVSIDSVSNSRLQEKAGREGFRANGAYRDFKEILQNFLAQTARDFFRDDSPDDTWRLTKLELEREAAARKRHDQQARQRRKEFRNKLIAAEQRLGRGDPEREISQVLSELEVKLTDATSDPDLMAASQKVLSAEGHAQRAVSEIRDRYRLPRPRGIALPKAVSQDWESYQREYEALERTLFRDSRMEIERRAATAAGRLGSVLDRRRRLEAGLNERCNEAQSRVAHWQREVRSNLNLLITRVATYEREAVQAVEHETRSVMAALASSNTEGLSDQQVADLRRVWEDQLEHIADQQTAILQGLNERIFLAIGEGAAPDQGDVIDVIGSLEQEVVLLRDRADEDLELAQLGLALQVINHEFSASIRAVRNNLRRLQAWADANKALRSVYSDLRASFEHLDAYLRLFTPLNRRLYRRGTVVKGSDIETFLRDLFQERLTKEDISLQASSAFRDASVRAYPSTLYPVFVNLVDNAIYWLTTRGAPRVISLDYEPGAWSVADNGPGVPTVDRQRIFELGFSRKPNGRGMGLHISRDVLAKEGWQLELSVSRLGGAMFVLREPVPDSSASSDEQQDSD